MWTITEKQVTTEEGEDRLSYGVKCGECTVDDITTSHPEISNFVDELNQHNASPVHIYELIENFLGM